MAEIAAPCVSQLPGNHSPTAATIADSVPVSNASTYTSDCLNHQSHPTAGLVAMESAMDDLTNFPEYPILDLAAMFDNIPVPLPSLSRANSQGNSIHRPSPFSRSMSSRVEAPYPLPQADDRYTFVGRTIQYLSPAYDMFGGPMIDYEAIEKASELAFMASHENNPHVQSVHNAMLTTQASQSDRMYTPSMYLSSLPDHTQSLLTDMDLMSQQYQNCHIIHHHHHHHFPGLGGTTSNGEISRAMEVNTQS